MVLYSHNAQNVAEIFVSFSHYECKFFKRHLNRLKIRLTYRAFNGTILGVFL